jgi:hypothetical protein
MESNATTGINKRFHFEFLLPFLLHPGATFQKIVQKRATWLTPLLVISLLTVARVMLAAPPVVPITPDTTFPPPGIQVSPGKGQELQDGVTLVSAPLQKGGGGGEERIPPEAGTGSRVENILPAAMTTISLWTGWFLLSILLYVGMVINGSNNSFIETLNLTAWASLPLALRQTVMLVAALAIPSLGTNPTGLAALTSSHVGPLGTFLTVLLKSVDIYLIWQVILIVIGLRQVSPLPLRRILGITLVSLTLFLVLAAIPSFLTSIFAQLTAPVPTGGGFGG